MVIQAATADVMFIGDIIKQLRGEVADARDEGPSAEASAMLAEVDATCEELLRFTNAIAGLGRPAAMQVTITILKRLYDLARKVLPADCHGAIIAVERAGTRCHLRPTPNGNAMQRAAYMATGNPRASPLAFLTVAAEILADALAEAGRRFAEHARIQLDRQSNRAIVAALKERPAPQQRQPLAPAARDNYNGYVNNRGPPAAPKSRRLPDSLANWCMKERHGTNRTPACIKALKHVLTGTAACDIKKCQYHHYPSKEELPPAALAMWEAERA